MVLNDAKGLKQGSTDVIRAYVGDTLVYPSEQKYLKVKPTTIWLTEANNFTEDVEVISNTRWNVENESIND